MLMVHASVRKQKYTLNGVDFRYVTTCLIKSAEKTIVDLSIRSLVSFTTETCVCICTTNRFGL